MESFSKTQNFNGVKKNLLKLSNYKTINQARREYPNLSDNEIYQNLLENILRKDRERRIKKTLPKLAYFNGELEVHDLGRLPRNSNKSELRPYKTNIDMSYDAFQRIDPANIKHKREILTEDIDNSAPLIFWEKNEEDAREKANQVVKKNIIR